MQTDEHAKSGIRRSNGVWIVPRKLNGSQLITETMMAVNTTDQRAFVMDVADIDFSQDGWLETFRYVSGIIVGRNGTIALVGVPSHIKPAFLKQEWSKRVRFYKSLQEVPASHA